MKCCIFLLHKNGGHVLNKWLAHLCNPQVKSHQLLDLKGYHVTNNHKALIPLVYEGRGIKAQTFYWVTLICF